MNRTKKSVYLNVLMEKFIKKFFQMKKIKKKIESDFGEFHFQKFNKFGALKISIFVLHIHLLEF